MMLIRIKIQTFMLVITSVWICIFNARLIFGLPQENSPSILETVHRGMNKKILDNSKYPLIAMDINNQESEFGSNGSMNSTVKSENFTRCQSLRDLEACILASPFDLLSMEDTIRLLSYLRKIKIRMKPQPIIDRLERNLEIAFQQMKTKKSNIVKHLQFLAVVFFLRLYAMMKFCNSSAKFKSNQNQNSAAVTSCLCCSADSQTIFYFEKMVDVYRYSLKKLFHVPRCKKKKRRRRPENRGTTDDSEESFRDTLISNFLANSLPDLTLPNYEEKTLLASDSNIEQSVTHTPILHISSTTQVADWSIYSSTDLYPVPLITAKPQLTTLGSYPSWKPANSDTNDPWTNNNNHHYHHHQHQVSMPTSWYPNRPVQDDLFLQFPSAETSGSSGNYQEPYFVEPIVVSSVDQLPTNYPIPMENASLSHNPVTVVVGGGPPEIVVLQDVSFQSVIETESNVPPPAGASAAGEPVPVQQEPVTAADPVAPAAASGSAAGPLAAAAAGLGALGAAGIGTGIVGGALAGGIGAGSAAVLGAGAGGGAAGGVGGDATADGSVGVGVSVAPTDVLAYSPAVDEELETVYGDFYDLIEWITSFRFVRTILTAMYSLVFPHISLLLTSGFTVVAFFFPWLYPHIVVPVMSFISSISS